MATPEKLLVLYTGGTIGMQMSADGLAPASGFEAVSYTHLDVYKRQRQTR